MISQITDQMITITLEVGVAVKEGVVEGAMIDMTITKTTTLVREEDRIAEDQVHHLKIFPENYHQVCVLKVMLGLNRTLQLLQ